MMIDHSNDVGCDDYTNEELLASFHKSRESLLEILRQKLSGDTELVDLFMERLHYTLEILGATTENWLTIKTALIKYLNTRITTKGLFTQRRSDDRSFYNDFELAVIGYWACVTGVRPFIPAKQFCNPDDPIRKQYHAIFERNAKASAALLERKKQQEQLALSKPVKKSKKKKTNGKRRKNNRQQLTKHG